MLGLDPRRAAAMDANFDWVHLVRHLRVFVVHTVAMLIDTAFLALWVAAQWALSELVISSLPISSIKAPVLVGFQVLFGFSTFVPIGVYIYVDTRIMILRAKRQIQRLH